MGRLLSIILIFTLSALFLLVVFLAPEFLAAAAGSTGRDLTFTGRTHLWEDILREVADHWVIGSGFQGFWVLDNPELLALYDIYIWLPNQAHNGYLDILNEVGIIGLVLFFLVIFNYFRGLRKLQMPHYWKWFVVAALILNLQESTFIRPQVVTGVFFLFSYVALYSDIYKKERNDYDNDESNLVEQEQNINYN
jgi:exopolysaccharide production protein ExoQ